VSAWNTFLKELRQWIKTYHTTGLTWNPSGADASSFAGKGASSSSSSGGAPPPPPGPPPMEIDTSPPKAGGASAQAALFAEINAVKDRQTGGRTEGLRKVTKEMKTKYQDPATKTSAPTSAPKTTTTKGGSSTSSTARPPKFALEGSKWVVENQINNKSIVIDNPEVRHTVYIYKCENSVVQIKGKINAITVDSCKKTGIVFDNAIAAIDVVNCNSVQVQITGKVPSIQVDKTSGCQIFLSNEALNCEIVTSKSDEMNVCLPGATPTDYMIEIPVPEQFKTTIVNRKLVTEAVSHLG